MDELPVPPETAEEIDRILEENEDPAPADADTDPYTELLAERDSLRDQLLRAMADLQNFRRRAAIERDSVRDFTVETFALELLPVLDNFERTTRAAEAGADIESLLVGVRLIEKQLKDALASRKVVRTASVGQPFDPAKHEAIGTDPTEDTPEGFVTAEVEAGYCLGDKTIRPARVRVAAKP